MAKTRNPATSRQLDTIATEARRAGFGDPQDAVHQIGITSSNWRFDLSVTDASDLIDRLRGGLVPPAEPEPGAFTESPDGMSAVDALTVLGHTAVIQSAHPDGTLVTRRGRVTSIVPSTKDGTPALSLDTGDGRYPNVRLSLIRTWTLAESA